MHRKHELHPSGTGRIRDRVALRREDIEPRMDADDQRHLLEEWYEPPHKASHYDAGTGQGTVTGPPRDGPTQDRPILDGSTQSYIVEATVPNPYRGEPDPSAITHQPALRTTKTDRWMIAATIAAVILTTLLLLVMRWEPLWCGIALVVMFAGLLAMMVVRISRVRRPLRLWLDAALMAVIWLVPLTVFLTVLLGNIEQISGFGE